MGIATLLLLRPPPRSIIFSMSVLLSSLLYRLSSIVPTSDLFSFSSPGLCVSILCWFQPTWISPSGVTAHPPSPLVPLISFLSHSESAFGGCRNCSVGYRGGSWFQLQENSGSVGLRSQNVRAGSSSLESGAPRQETAAFLFLFLNSEKALASMMRVIHWFVHWIFISKHFLSTHIIPTVALKWSLGLPIQW